MGDKIAIGCDPNAAELKKVLIGELENLGYSFVDYGSDDSVYANVAIKVAEAVASGKYTRGILICGTGIGMSIAANKVKGAYAALVSNAYSAERAIKSNNANILCLGAFTTGVALAKTYLKIWMGCDFDPKSPSAVKVARYKEYDMTR